MVVIMVHWLIKKGIENEQAFENMWKKDDYPAKYRAVP